MGLNIGIDYGHTITDYPEYFSQLTKYLRGWGCKIHIISGMPPPVEVSKDLIKAELRRYKIDWDYLDVHNDREHTTEDKHKGKYCLEHKIDLMFDDDNKPGGYIEDIRKWSPLTKIIVVKEIKNL